MFPPIKMFPEKTDFICPRI